MYLTEPRLELLSRLFAAAKRVQRAVAVNMIWVLLYNIVGFTLVMKGFVGPITCAVLMPVSSVTVILFATQQKYFKEKK